MATSSDPPTLSPRVLYLLTSEVSHVLVRDQLGSLVARGWEITVGVGDGGAAGVAATWDPGVEVERVAFVREMAVLRDIRALWSTIRLVRRVRPDIVNASTPKAALLGMVAARVVRVPIRVFVIRGLRLETTSGWRRRLLRTTDRLTARCATHVVANSDSVLAVARSEGIVGPDVGEVIGAGSGNGVDVDRFRPPTDEECRAARLGLGLPQSATVIGFVGRLTRDKGVPDLVGAFTQRFAGRNDVRLLLVGGVEAGDPLDSTTSATIESDDRIVTIPWMADTRDVYRAADIVAFPSYREGLPNVPLEAQASGRPVVGYAATGTVDAVIDGTTALLVPVGDRAGLGDRLVDLTGDADCRTTLGAAGRRHVVDRFERSVVLAGIARRYDDWLSRAGGRRRRSTAGSTEPPQR